MTVVKHSSFVPLQRIRFCIFPRLLSCEQRDLRAFTGKQREHRIRGLDVHLTEMLTTALLANVEKQVEFRENLLQEHKRDSEQTESDREAEFPSTWPLFYLALEAGELT